MLMIVALVASVLTCSSAFAQSAAKPEHVARVTEFIAKSPGPYSKIADGVWETSYKGTHMTRIVVRIATAGDGIFFLVTLFPRASIILDESRLLRMAEFNGSYDYVKLAVDKTAVSLRMDVPAALVDLTTFGSLENQAALAADTAYALIRPPTFIQ